MHGGTMGMDNWAMGPLPTDLHPRASEQIQIGHLLNLVYSTQQQLIQLENCMHGGTMGLDNWAMGPPLKGLRPRALDQPQIGKQLLLFMSTH